MTRVLPYSTCKELFKRRVESRTSKAAVHAAMDFAEDLLDELGARAEEVLKHKQRRGEERVTLSEEDVVDALHRLLR